MPFICIVFVLHNIDVDAQASLVQRTIDKIESYKNFSYQSINKTKEYYTNDTITEQNNAVFAKVPDDKNSGYLFNIETINENNKVTYTDLYNGQNLIHIIPRDSTYSIQKFNEFNKGTLLSSLNWIKSRLEKTTSEIIKTPDTTINGVDSYHLIATISDTIINKERNYTFAHLFIDKLSGMPDCIIVQARYSTFGDGISTYYSETRYFDYKVNQDNIDITSMNFPQGFRPLKEQPRQQSALLSPGTVAPDFTLYTPDGKKMTLTQMKGKVVMLDFFFIGCGNCMESLKSLNDLHEKYKNQSVAMSSMTFRDSKKSTTWFKKNYNITYPIYIDAADVVKSYNVEEFPTFYFIDKEGKIANAIIGYDDHFEQKASSIMDNLLNK